MSTTRVNSATQYSQELEENDGGRRSGQSELQVAPAVVLEEEAEEGHGGHRRAPQGGGDQRAQGTVLRREPLYANGGSGRHHPLQQITQVVLSQRGRTIVDLEGPGIARW